METTPLFVWEAGRNKRKDVKGGQRIGGEWYAAQESASHFSFKLQCAKINPDSGSLQPFTPNPCTPGDCKQSHPKNEKKKQNQGSWLDGRGGRVARGKRVADTKIN